MSVPHGIDRSGAAGGTGAQSMVGSLGELTDPNADRLLGWQDSAGDLKFFDLSSGLTFSGTTLTLDTELQALAAVTSAADTFPYFTGSGAASTATVTSFIRTLLDDATALAARTTLGTTAPEASGEAVIGVDASTSASIPWPAGGAMILNGKISLSVAANALTITLQTSDGTNPTASNPVYALIPQGNPQDGTYAVRKATTATTLVISSGSTLAHLSATASPVYFYLLDNSGTLELAASTKFFGGMFVQSTTAEGGTGGADSPSNLYSTTARLNPPCVCVGRWKSTQTTAGVWAAATGELQTYPFPFKKPTSQIITSVGGNTYTMPWDTLSIKVIVTGGGGGGGGSDANTAAESGAGAGGGGGGTAIKIFAADEITQTVTTTIGASGTAGSGTNGTTGGTGGSSSFGVFLVANGGTGGTGSGVATSVRAAFKAGGSGGSASGGAINITGGDGAPGLWIHESGASSNVISAGGLGGSSIWGSGGKAGGRGTADGAGHTAGTAGAAYGSGGGGAGGILSTTGAGGGAGAQGITIIEEYYT